MSWKPRLSQLSTFTAMWIPKKPGTTHLNAPSILVRSRPAPRNVVYPCPPSSHTIVPGNVPGPMSTVSGVVAVGWIPPVPQIAVITSPTLSKHLTPMSPELQPAARQSSTR